MKFVVNTSHVDDVEHGIAPPMRKAVTLPLRVDTGVDGRIVQVDLYICIGVFRERSVLTDQELADVARAIADTLKQSNNNGIVTGKESPLRLHLADPVPNSLKPTCSAPGRHPDGYPVGCEKDPGHAGRHAALIGEPDEHDW